MKKIITFIVVLAIIWAVPGFRAQVTTGALPLLEKLGPSGEAVIRPARREAAKKQMRSVMRVLDAEAQSGRELPTDRTFQQWIRQRMPELTGLDPWGQPYWLDTRSGIIIGTSGPDRVRGTDDDITHAARR